MHFKLLKNGACKFIETRLTEIELFEYSTSLYSTAAPNGQNCTAAIT